MFFKQAQRWEQKSHVQTPRERKADVCSCGNVLKLTASTLEPAQMAFFMGVVVASQITQVRGLQTLGVEDHIIIFLSY